MKRSGSFQDHTLENRKTKAMKIKELTEGERPRERMMEYGAASLGTGELLAVLLRSGTRGESALDLAQRLLSLASTAAPMAPLNCG